MDRVVQIVRKEWQEVFRNRLVLFTVAFLPLILTALPLIILGAVGSTEGMDEMLSSDLPGEFGQLCEGLDGADCSQYFLLSQFMLMFMLIPLAIPSTIASYSIVGEKTTRTLEPILATPITTLELLLGKSLAAFVPAVLATWLGFAVFTVGAALLRVGPAVIGRILSPLWLLAVLIVGPLLAVASVCVAIMVSSRTRDPRVAEQISVLVIMPLLGLFFGQVSGLILINEKMILWMAAGLVVLDAGLLAFATHLFDRESILTRWK
ncbi:MAG: ABC transporter permease subunit [Anaerolineales bacterium]|nr:ABC transporter permease subunit [Anaerolineales bacterium]